MTRRLHRAGIAVLGVAGLRGALVPIAVAVVTTADGGAFDLVFRAVGFALLGAGGAALFGYATWETKRYWVTDHAIGARQGLFSVRETTIPLERVQAIDTVQGPVQRLFGVTAVHVQAAGGGREGEIVLEALSSDAVAELRAALAGAGAGAAGAPVAAGAPEPDAVRRLSGRALLLAAVTSGQLGVILPLLAAGSQVIDDVLVGDDPARVAGGVDLLPDTAREVAVAALALLAIAWLLSIAGAIVAFAGFTVTRTGDRLQIRRGLLARREATVPVARIQAVTVIEGLLRQPFGLAAVRVEVAGYAREAPAAQTLFPLLPVREVEALLAEMAPALAGSRGAPERPPARALRRYALPPATIAAVPAAGVSLAAATAWPLLAIVPAVLLGLAAYSAAAWRLEPHRVTIRSRRLARRTAIISRRRLQQHSIRQTPFQRRGALATLAVAAGSGTRAQVAHLEERTARELFAVL